jgi:hypothetical protein
VYDVSCLYARGPPLLQQKDNYGKQGEPLASSDLQLISLTLTTPFRESINTIIKKVRLFDHS